MELVLTRHSETEIDVSCDGAPSHRFELASVFPFQAAPDAPIADPVEYGKQAYLALFGADTAASKALDALPERVVLVADDPALQSVPWEYAYGPNEWVVTEVPFVRALPADKRQAAAAVDQPLHTIVVPSHPLGGGLAPLDTEGEWVRLTEIIGATANAVTLERAEPATLSALRRLLAGQRHRVIHFTGHGGQDAEGALLYFEREIGDLALDEVNARGNVDAVSAREFIKHIRGTAQLVVLSACVSATPGETPFNNLAASLVAHKVPYALGMRFSVTEIDANIFCKSFYDELARGVPIEEAVRQGRLGLADSPRAWAIGVPILYTSLETAAPPFVRQSGAPRIEAHRPLIDLEALPAVTGALHGRDGNLLGLEWYLTGDRRVPIVTVHGPGGQGKTALARVGAERVAYEWPGGVLALAFENLPSKAQVLQSICRFIGADVDALADPAAAETAAEAYFDQRRTLLVLDGAESLVAGVDKDDPAAIELAQWLQQLPGRRVGLLVTSRRYLGWEGETALELAGLDPEQGGWLFRQNAPQRQPEIDQEQAMALSAQVGGHPLSLRLLGGAFNETDAQLAEFVGDFEDQLDRAENKYVQASHRQLTLQTSIGTSVSALSDEHRALLGAAWVFQGAFSPASLAVVLHGEAGDGEIEAVAKSLNHLWHHSLLERLQLADDSVLYRSLPVLRQYFRRHLPRAVEQAELDGRFARAMAPLAARLYETRDEDPGWVNFANEWRADFNRAAGSLEGAELAAFAEHWGWLCYLLDDNDRAAELFESVLDWTKKHDKDAHVTMLDNLAVVKADAGDHEAAIELYKKELALVRKNKDAFTEAMTLEALGGCYLELEDYAHAESNYEAALKSFREQEDQPGEARVLLALGRAYHGGDKAKQAIEASEAAITLFETQEDGASLAAALLQLARIHLTEGEWEPAGERFGQALAAYEAAEDGLGVASAVDGLGDVALSQGRHADALPHYQRSLPLYEAAGASLNQAFVLEAIGDCNLELGQLQAAYDAFNAAGPLYNAVGAVANEASVMRKIAAVLVTANNDHALGAKWIAQAISSLEAAELDGDSGGYSLDDLRGIQAECEANAAAPPAK
ncbi:MAG TPA: tetratricopeptide repeat protein [Herpetosiphonaceae bacterium]